MMIQLSPGAQYVVAYEAHYFALYGFRTSRSLRLVGATNASATAMQWCGLVFLNETAFVALDLAGGHFVYYAIDLNASGIFRVLSQEALLPSGSQRGPFVRESSNNRFLLGNTDLLAAQAFRLTQPAGGLQYSGTQ